MKTARPKKLLIKVALFSAVFVGVLTTSAITIKAQAQTAQPTTFGSQTESSLTASPPRLGDDGSVILNPGDKKQIEVKVINSSETAMTINTATTDFVVADDGSTPIDIPNTDEKANRWSLASWLVLTPTEQTIAPHKTGIVNVLIEAPKDALPGGHYAMITHQPVLPSLTAKGLNAKQAAAAGIDQRVGTLLYVTIAGEVNEEAYVSDFTFPKFSEFGPVPYSFTIQNRSDIHIRPQIGLTIKNMFGQKVASLQPETKNIFPLSARKFEGKWDRVWGFGLYTAEVSVSYGTQGKIVVDRTQFWLLPIKLLLAGLIILLTVIAMFISIRRHMLHRKQDQQKHIADLENKLQQLEKEKLKKYED